MCYWIKTKILFPFILLIYLKCHSSCSGNTNCFHWFFFEHSGQRFGHQKTRHMWAYPAVLCWHLMTKLIKNKTDDQWRIRTRWCLQQPNESVSRGSWGVLPLPVQTTTKPVWMSLKRRRVCVCVCVCVCVLIKRASCCVIINKRPHNHHQPPNLNKQVCACRELLFAYYWDFWQIRNRNKRAHTHTHTSAVWTHCCIIQKPFTMIYSQCYWSTAQFCGKGKDGKWGMERKTRKRQLEEGGVTEADEEEGNEGRRRSDEDRTAAGICNMMIGIF